MAVDVYEDRINESLGNEFLKKALTGIYVAFAAAHEFCQANYPEPERKNLEPLVRRANVEKNLKATVDMMPELSVSNVKPAGTPWFHIEILGASVILTTSAVRYPGGPVNSATFREVNASPQLRFEELEGPHANEAGRCYAVLTYSSYISSDLDEQRMYGHLPGSVHIGVPSPDLRKYLYLDNLMTRFPDIVKNHAATCGMEENMINVYLRRSEATLYHAS